MTPDRKSRSGHLRKHAQTRRLALGDHRDDSSLGAQPPHHGEVSVHAEGVARALWDGLTYGVLASMAFYSLRNLIYVALKAKGCDTNDDFPLAKVKSEGGVS